MLYDKVDRGNIEKMVRSFYAMLVKDDIVGPYFIKSLGSDLNNDKWYDHYKTLDAFWLLLMTGEDGYRGDPFPPHVFIGQLYIKTFDQWLLLFNKHVHELYVPEIAESFYKKSEILANKFKAQLEIEE